MFKYYKLNNSKMLDAETDKYIEKKVNNFEVPIQVKDIERYHVPLEKYIDIIQNSNDFNEVTEKITKLSHYNPKHPENVMFFCRDDITNKVIVGMDNQWKLINKNKFISILKSAKQMQMLLGIIDAMSEKLIIRNDKIYEKYKNMVISDMMLCITEDIFEETVDNMLKSYMYMNLIHIHLPDKLPKKTAVGI